MDVTSTIPEPPRSVLARIPQRWGKTIACGPGWFALIEELDRAVSAVAPDYVVLQVKEKFGTLRFYWELPELADPDSAGPDDVRRRIAELVAAAEARSAVTCESCGAPARRVEHGHGWVQTRCTGCHPG